MKRKPPRDGTVFDLDFPRFPRDLPFQFISLVSCPLLSITFNILFNISPCVFFVLRATAQPHPVVDEDEPVGLTQRVRSWYRPTVARAGIKAQLWPGHVVRLLFPLKSTSNLQNGKDGLAWSIEDLSV